MTLAFRITYPCRRSVLYPILPIFNFTKLFPNWASKFQVICILLISQRLKDEMTSSVWLRLKMCLKIDYYCADVRWKPKRSDCNSEWVSTMHCGLKLRSQQILTYKNGQVQFSHFRLSRLQTAPLNRFKAVRN